MRRRLALAMVLCITAGSVLAEPSGARTPTQDSASGTGGTQGYTSFDFNVVSGPLGENPTGTAVLEVPIAGLHAEAASITCLSVAGNTATFAGPLLPNVFGDAYGKVTVVDNDSSGTALDTYAARGYASPPDCSVPETGILGTQPLLTGDIVVVNAPPLPTSTEQCKNGGWQTYGLFKNQGDCVSLVATIGRNQPAGN